MQHRLRLVCVGRAVFLAFLRQINDFLVALFVARIDLALVAELGAELHPHAQVLTQMVQHIDVVLAHEALARRRALRLLKVSIA